MLAVAPSHSWSSVGSPSVVNPTPSRGSLGDSSSLHPSLSNQRRSVNSTRKPLRSSPLAGPVLQLDSSIPEVKDEEYRPNRISSLPDLLSLLSPPPARLARPKTAETPCQSRSMLSPSGSTSSLSLKKSFTSAFSSGSVKKETTHISGQSSSRGPKIADGHSQNAHKSAQVPEHPLPKAHDPTDNSWLTSNTYEVTPKFTRLGLGSNVVLPVSAKEHKRRSHSQQTVPTSFKAATARLYRNDNTNTSNISTSPSSNPSPTNFPEDSLSYPSSGRSTSSFTSSSESLNSSHPQGSSASSLTTTSNITTIAEGDETKEYRHEESSTNASNGVMPTPKKGPLPRVRSFGLFSIRSVSDVPSQSLTGPKSTVVQADAPIQEKMDVDTVQTHQEVKLGIIISKFDLNAITTTTITEQEQAKGTTLEVLTKLKVKRTSMKRLWKSISKWQQSRS